MKVRCARGLGTRRSDCLCVSCSGRSPEAKLRSCTYSLGNDSAILSPLLSTLYPVGRTKIFHVDRASPESISRGCACFGPRRDFVAQSSGLSIHAERRYACCVSSRGTRHTRYDCSFVGYVCPTLSRVRHWGTNSGRGCRAGTTAAAADAAAAAARRLLACLVRCCSSRRRLAGGLTRTAGNCAFSGKFKENDSVMLRSGGCVLRKWQKTRRVAARRIEINELYRLCKCSTEHFVRGGMTTLWLDEKTKWCYRGFDRASLIGKNKRTGSSMCKTYNQSRYSIVHRGHLNECHLSILGEKFECLD